MCTVKDLSLTKAYLHALVTALTDNASCKAASKSLETSLDAKPF